MFESAQIRVQVRGKSRTVAARIRRVSDEFIVFVHGWAAHQEGFEGAFGFSKFDEYSVCTFDLLGHGLSDKPRGFGYSMEDQAAVTAELIRTLDVRRAHLVGHSMGGLVGLLAANALGDKLGSFITVEGNLVPEDAGVRIRSMVRQPLPVFKAVGAKAMQAMMAVSKDKNTRTWSRWWGKTIPEAIYGEAKSIIEWSDSGKLISKFRDVDNRAYLVGDMSDKTATLAELEDKEVIKIPKSGHFPMFDNPDGFYGAIAERIRK